MKKITSIIIVLIAFTNCKAQNLKIKDISNSNETNYILATLNVNNIKRISLENNFVTVFEQFDTKATLENYSPGTDEVISSLIISVSPDGDYYTSSKLYKIEGLTNPEVLEIKDGKFPEILIRVEHGIASERKIEMLEFEGVQ